MKGYRTIAVAAFALLWAVLAQSGMDVPLEDQGAITTGGLALLMVVLRKITTGPLGES